MAASPPTDPLVTQAPTDRHMAPGARVDWWGWQTAVRSAATPVPAPRGIAWAIRRLPAVVLGLLVVAGVVLVAAGGVVFGGRPTEAARAVAGWPPATSQQSALSEGRVGESALLAEVPGPPEPPVAPPAVPARAVYAVATIEADFVDPTRPDPGRGDAADGRSLRTVIRFPDVRSAGPFPLVIFAHGYATNTAAYASLLDDLASTGYVVAAPEFPLTSTALPGPVGSRDLAEQVEDVAFVISSVLELATRDGPLRGAIGTAPVAVVGHSDGGITAAGAAFASRLRDPRVGAAVVLSGARGDFGGPWFVEGSPALLAVHGDADHVNPFSSSESLYAADRSGGGRYLVRVPGGGHDDAFSSPRVRPMLVVLIDEFLRAALGTDPSAAGRIEGAATVPGVLELVAWEPVAHP